MAKRKPFKPGLRPLSKLESKMIQWCLDNSIAIAITPNWDMSDGNWKIEIRLNNKVHVDPANYTVANVHDKMYEYYKYYYDKYNKISK